MLTVMLKKDDEHYPIPDFSTRPDKVTAGDIK